MNLRRVAAAAVLAAGSGLAACATQPNFPIESDPLNGVGAQPPAPAAGRPGGPVAMTPIPNPGEGGSNRARPVQPTSESALPPIAGARTASGAGSVDRPARYRVQAGDTLFSIARRYGVSPQALADANDMTFQSILRNGQTIRIPGGSETTQAARAQPSPPPPASTGTPPARNARPAREVPPPTSSGATLIVPTTPAPSSTDVATLGRGLFRWPAEGEVIGRFGPGSGGQRNDGINIASTAGAPVLAAAAGEVAYTGNSIPGFGNLVLVRHPGGWVTAYGHLQSSSVSMRQTVTQGQQIGVVGMTGNVTSPQLHFEVRYAPSARDRARPIDPMTVLPPR